MSSLICLIEDDKGVASLIQEDLEEEGHKVIIVSSGQEAKEILIQSPPDLIILDFQLFEETATSVIKVLRGIDAFVPIVLFTAAARQEDKNTMAILGVDFVLEKGGNSDTLPRVIDRLLMRPKSAVSLLGDWISAHAHMAGDKLFTFGDRKLSLKEVYEEARKSSSVGRKMLRQIELGMLSALFFGSQEK